MSTNCDVSVIITTFRREKLVLEAIASALGQGLERDGLSMELLVVDDSAEASARDAVEGLRDPRIRYVPRARPSGGRPAEVRNEAAALARGQYLYFLDDDDRVADGAVRSLVRALRGSRDAGVAFGNTAPFGDDAGVLATERAYFERVAAEARRLRGSRLRYAAQLMFAGTPFVNSACMIRHDVFDAHGGYDTTLAVCEDIELYLRAGRARGFVYVDETVLHYRTGAPSITHDLAGQDKESKVAFAYRTMWTRYVRDHGAVEFNALKVVSRLRRMRDAARRRLTGASLASA